MSRNPTTEVDERSDAVLEADEQAFWDRPADLDEPLVIADEDPTIDGEHETRVYMGQVRHTRADRDELDALADWAQDHACRELPRRAGHRPRRRRARARRMPHRPAASPVSSAATSSHAARFGECGSRQGVYNAPRNERELRVDAVPGEVGLAGLVAVAEMVQPRE